MERLERKVMRQQIAEEENEKIPHCVNEYVQISDPVPHLLAYCAFLFV
jgi:hypothetical protein